MKVERASLLRYEKSISVTSAILISKVQPCPTSSALLHERAVLTLFTRTLKFLRLRPRDSLKPRLLVVELLNKHPPVISLAVTHNPVHQLYSVLCCTFVVSALNHQESFHHFVPEDTNHSLLYDVGATKIVLIDTICWHVKAFTEVYCYGSVNVTKCFSVNS